MFMDYRNDKKEIISFINTLSFSPEKNISICLNRFTKSMAEQFLDNRAKYIKDEIVHDIELHNAFCILSNICNVKSQKCLTCPVNKYCNSYINRCRNSIKSDSLMMIDLFCGAGGLSLGFTQEGFITALANDNQECCVDTYAHNHPETSRDKIILGDVKYVADNIEKLIDVKTVDIIVGGPPCQGFSMANRQRLIDDPRNQLYKNYVDTVKKVHPKFFVMENVKGMLSVAEQVKEDFRNIGYSVECHVLNAKDFGVPQSRERLIYIGNRLNIDNEMIFQQIIELSSKIRAHVLGDALFGLRSLEASRIKNATDSSATPAATMFFAIWRAA